MTDDGGGWVHAIAREVAGGWLGGIAGLDGQPVRAVRAAGLGVVGFLGGGHHLGPGCGARLEAAGAERLVRTWRDAAPLLAEALGEP